MSFLRHVGIFRSDDFYAAGSERLPDSQRSSGSMSSSRLFLGRLLSSSACLRFTGQERFSIISPRRTMIFQRTATSPLTYCLSSRVHSSEPLYPLLISVEARLICDTKA
jgi:hypothetical protein